MMSDLYENLDKRLYSERDTWDIVWINVARAIAGRSYDPRSKVGAIIVADDNTRVLAVGYNGAASGLPNEVESLEPGQSGFLHAELNAAIKSDFSFPKKKKMYVTMSPCLQCARVIVNAKIGEVVYADEYRDAAGIELLKKLGICVRKL